MIAANVDVADYVPNLQRLLLTVLGDKNHHPLSSILVPPTSILVPPSFILIPTSTVLRPPSTVLRPPTTVLRPPSSVHRPPSTVLCPLSSVIRRPSSLLPYSWLVFTCRLVFLSNESRIDTTYVLIATYLLKYYRWIIKANIQTLLLSHNTHF